jgi:hypothetical protein
MLVPTMLMLIPTTIFMLLYPMALSYSFRLPLFVPAVYLQLFPRPQVLTMLICYAVAFLTLLCMSCSSCLHIPSIMDSQFSGAKCRFDANDIRDLHALKKYLSRHEAASALHVEPNEHEPHSSNHYITKIAFTKQGLSTWPSSQAT